MIQERKKIRRKKITRKAKFRISSNQIIINKIKSGLMLLRIRNIMRRSNYEDRGRNLCTKDLVQLATAGSTILHGCMTNSNTGDIKLYFNVLILHYK